MSQSKIYISLEKNKNLMYNNMVSKTRARNTNFLLALFRKSKGQSTTEKVDKIIELYRESKISQVQTAENLIKLLLTAETEKEKKSASKKYEKLITKYEANKPLNIRLVEKKQVRKTAAIKIIKGLKTSIVPKIKYTNLKKAQSQITFNLDHIRIYDKLTINELLPKLRKYIIIGAKDLIAIKNNIKLTIGCKSSWGKYDVNFIDDDDEDIAEKDEFDKVIVQTIKTKAVEVYSRDALDDVIDNLFDSLERLFANMNHKQSGLTLIKIHNVFLESFSIVPIRGSSYIPTPDRFNNKSGLINIQNDDNECFKWCVKYHQSAKVKHSDRLSVLKQLDDKYNYDNVKFPAGYNDIKHFEENNKVCVFVYTLSSNNEIIRDFVGNPDYIMNDNINLLRIEDEDKSHYIYIKHLSRLINLNAHKSHHGCWCPYCEKPQPEENIKDHIGKCYKLQFNDGALLKLPEKDTYMKFENHKNKLVRPFIIYADTESTLIKTEDINKIHKHVINSCCYYFVCTFDNSRNKIKTFDGEDCLFNMITDLYNLSTECFKEMEKNRSVSTDESLNFISATNCTLCGDCFIDERAEGADKSLFKIKDHDYATGKYKGAVHCKCHITHYANKYLPVVFHNLRGYDGHQIIKEAFNLFPDKDLSIIPNSYEKFMSFKLGALKFIDSFQFMATSLEKLVENLYDKNDKYTNFPCMKQYFDKHMDILCRKGFYPYEFMDNNDKLNYPELPPQEAFYSKLSQSSISDDDYKHAQNVYNQLHCKTFKDYHMAYLQCDVLLLADVFENFRNTCENYYGLDPANYISAPGLAWDAMLLKTNINLELMNDLEVLDIMERMKKGGLCFVGSKRHAVANNKYMENYDESKESNYITYLDEFIWLGYV